MFQEVQDFVDESDALRALLAPLSEREFERKTQFKDYSVHDVVAHLHQWNWAADLSLRDPEAFRVFAKRASAEIASGRPLVALADEWLEGVRNRAACDAWQRFYPELSEHFALAEPEARVEWMGPPMSARSSITARLMETWAHAQELYDLLGVERADTDRIRSIALLGVRTFGWSFANRGLEVPAERPYVRLTAPSGALWEWNAPDQEDRVEGCASEFCQVVTQVRSLADTSLRARGDTARRWLSLAQCFAGPPAEPPLPGTRFCSVSAPARAQGARPRRDR